MAKFDIINLKKKKVGEIELADAVFAADPNDFTMYEAAKMQQINRRRGTVGVKNTSLVAGGGKKPWRQKHTGRARQGSIRASQWVGGGKAMRPLPRDYHYRPPANVRKGALRSALSLRARENKLLILDKFELEAIKTQAALEALEGLGLADALVIDAKVNANLHKSVRNLDGFDALPPEGLNVEDVLRHESIVLTAPVAKQIEGALAP